MATSLDREANEKPFAVICAWHANKREGDSWAEARGFILSHSICPECEAKAKKELSEQPTAAAPWIVRNKIETAEDLEKFLNGEK